jgi:hypothetical protein
MFRPAKITLSLAFAGYIGLTSAGCASKLFNSEMLKPSSFKPAIMEGHVTEQRVITRFTDAMAENKEQSLRSIVSTRFEHKALRSKDSFKDLEILSLPKSELKVVESTQLSVDRYETIAEEEKTKTKYQFIIVRDPQKNRWVVDDVMLRQQKKGTRATKSSVEVMDLLLTVREFVSVWKDSDRVSVQGTFASSLRSELEPLPDAWFNHLLNSIRAEYEGDMARRPEAQMNESDAVVKLPSKTGFILLKVVRGDDAWLVSDIEVRKRKEDNHPGSLLRQARALRTVTNFLAAYKVADQTELERLTETKFYKNAISIGDLSMISLPSADMAPGDSEIQSFAGQLTVMIPDEADVVRIDLTTPELAGMNPEQRKVQKKKDEIEANFIVAGVTIYNRQTQQQRNLKSAFTAPARAELFMSALQSRDLAVLKELSIGPMADSVWNRINDVTLPLLPLDEVPGGEMALQSSHVRGEITELEFLSSDGRICSVVMRDENGSLKVDDVQFPGPSAQVASLRTHLELALPRVEMATAWKSKQLEGVRRQSSMDFNRLVWSNVTGVPDHPGNLPQLLMQPVHSTEANETRAVVQLSENGQNPVSVVLIKENRAWVIDEIAIREADGQIVELRKSLRQEIAQQFLTDPSGEIKQANFSTSSKDSVVVPAGGTSVEKRQGNLTMAPSPGSRKPATRGIDMTEDAAGIPPKVRPSESQKPKSSGSIIQFGPQSSASGAPRSGKVSQANLVVEDNSANEMSGMSDLPPRIRPRSQAESVEENGVVYFKGAPAAAKSSPASEDNDSTNSIDEGPFRDQSSISDPSKAPIEIPLK